MSEENKQVKVDIVQLQQYLEGDESKALKYQKKPTPRDRELNKIFSKIADLSDQAVNGFMMGSLIGGIVGAIVGLRSTIKTRNIVVLPISIMSTGCGLGLMMMGVSVVRNDDKYASINHHTIHRNFPQHTPFWQQKYANI